MTRLLKVEVLGVALVFGALVGCTPADIDYCSKFGVEGTTEYGKCIDYYHQQQALFEADRGVCEAKADETYPPTLYDRGHYAHVHGGFSPHGQYYGSHTVFIDPDWYHNRQIDALRMRIIAPCMQAKGWNSASDWQAGRHAVVPSKKSGKAKKLPWQQ